MRKAVFLSLALLVLVAAVSQAQPDPRRLKSTIINSDHDLRTITDPDAPAFAVCSFCHTPHQAVEANAVDPLWNHELSMVASYGVYGSDTLDAIPEDLGAGGTQSNLCLSCHDGTVAINALYNQGSIPSDPPIFMEEDHRIGNPPNGLTDDHPLNFVYDAALAALDGGLIEPLSSRYVDADEDMPLFDGKMQCTSCHDAHNGGPGPFLRRRNSTEVTFCLECHA